jgi:hypothetical protein
MLETAGANPTSATDLSRVAQIAGVFRGRELTRKDRKIASGLHPIDNLLNGGIAIGRISEIIGQPGSGRTSLAAAFAAAVTNNQAAAWIDAAGNFDPESIARAGVNLSRLLWVSFGGTRNPHRDAGTVKIGGRRASRESGWAAAATLKAAEWILAAGGFGLVLLDFGELSRGLPHGAALRLARAAERGGAAVLALGSHRLCGSFAALSIALRCGRACFSRPWPGAPALFDGLVIEARIARHKLGGSGQTVAWIAAEPAADLARLAAIEGAAPAHRRDRAATG